MSMYNMTNGFNPSCILVLPMLGKHENEYPRFRDCYVSEDMKHIVIFTRVGGRNRNSGYNEELLYKDPNFVKTFDDDYDSTYGYYMFNVPDKWKADFDKIVARKLSEVSDEYVNYVKSFYPKLSENGFIDLVFLRPSKDVDEVAKDFKEETNESV